MKPLDATADIKPQLPQARWERHLRSGLWIFVLALIIRVLTASFISAHIYESSWFPYGIYGAFDAQAQAVLDGKASPFFISDLSDTKSVIYPPGYSLWLAAIYGITGVRSVSIVLVIQMLIDSASVLLIVAIAVNSFGWNVGVATGILAAMSPLLAFYGATPLADTPTSWLILAGVWMLIRAGQHKSAYWALGAGIMVGASCWLRANGFLLCFAWAAVLALCVEATRQRKLLLASLIVLGSLAVLSPIVIRNTVAFETFVPTGLGVGTNLWEGIGETDRSAEFGAIYGDDALLEAERIEQDLPMDKRVNLYWPDGVARDRERARKALTVISTHPIWYAGVMLRRMQGLLHYAGDPSGIYGSPGINVTTEKCLPVESRVFPLTAFVTALGYMQSILRYCLLPLILVGLWLSVLEKPRMVMLIGATVFYYLVFGTFLHTEIRYSLPMQAVLLVFAGIAVSWIAGKIARATFRS